jgi:hypothetical protein
MCIMSRSNFKRSYNNISYVYDNSNNTAVSYGSGYLSLMLSGEQQQQAFNDSYTVLILEEAEKLYNKLTTVLTNSVIALPPNIRASSSLSLPAYNNIQRLTNL